MVIQRDCIRTVCRVIGISALLVLLCFAFLGGTISWVIACLALLHALFTVYFFRVPKREFGDEEGGIFSVADGKVVIVEKVYEKEYLKCECVQVSVYMSFFDVHTNFWPSDGEVTYSKYHPGRYFLAFLPKSSELNEHSSVAIRLPGKDTELLFKQIAGTFARRIVSYAEEGKSFLGGEQCGVIKFGSRLDMFLPLDAEILVKVGDRVKAVESLIAKMKG